MRRETVSGEFQDDLDRSNGTFERKVAAKYR
jgi:hypothetical protein